MGHPAVFYGLATVMVASALGVILARHPVYAVLSLVGTILALSGLFVLLQAYFVAVVQVLVYAGAILVLFLFVVMLLDLAPERVFRIQGGTMRPAGAIAGLLFLGQLILATRKGLTPLVPSAGEISPLPGTTAAVGQQLFTTYALPFEVASLLLLVGIVGAIVLAKQGTNLEGSDPFKR